MPITFANRYSQSSEKRHMREPTDVPFSFLQQFLPLPLVFSRSWYLTCSVSRTCEGKQGKGRFFALFQSTFLRALSVSLSPEQAREKEKGKNQLSSVFSLFSPRHMAPLSIFCEGARASRRERKRIRMQKKSSALVGKRVLDRKALDRTILKLDRFFSV